MKLLELFDTKIEPTSKHVDDNAYEEKATIGDRDIIFSAHDSYGQDDWEVMFLALDDKGRYSIKKTNNQLPTKVLSFIISAIHRFIHACKPARFHFSSEEHDASRIKLYRALVNRLTISDYKLSGTYQEHQSIYWVYEANHK